MHTTATTPVKEALMGFCPMEKRKKKEVFYFAAVGVSFFTSPSPPVPILPSVYPTRNPNVALDTTTSLSPPTPLRLRPHPPIATVSAFS